MKQFARTNILLGWATFFVSLIVYFLTIEPTVSFWDCGEFIRCTNLEVGHPPGAPLFLLIGRIFGIFAPSVESYALFINAVSAVSSAATIMFLFWTIVHLAKRFYPAQNNEYTGTQKAIIWGAGLVGALTYTVSDSFWFSAVEAEVYATSSLFTAVVFWAILKWENIADQPHAGRWLILIAYLVGLSVGVHLLNLLAIPAIVLVYYFRKHKATVNGTIGALFLGVVILAFVQFFVISKLVAISGSVDVFTANTLGWSINSGMLFFFIFVAFVLIGVIYWTHKQKAHAWLNTVALGILVILMGYSSYTMIIIRSSADVPLNENKPDNGFNLYTYINREQYGESPLINGQNYNTPPVDIEETRTNYAPKAGKYIEVGKKREYIYADEAKVIFPRMYSGQDRHTRRYQYWLGDDAATQLEGKKGTFTYEGREGSYATATLGANLEFFWKYQIVHMYWRYFAWNFIGRQNDLQGFGDNMNGNWISGVPFIDDARLGEQSKLPSDLKNNEGHNAYYFLPFLLGILGMIIQYSKSKKSRQDFITVFTLFFFTGLAIVVYLNQTPIQPRERDYAYVGSFYAFAIWIGLGVIALYDAFKKQSKALAVGTTVACGLLVPVNMAVQNWDDHDRSNRYTARALAYNYLNELPPNAVIFVFGDNDTFPLWYAQGVEKLRPDVRIINMMLFSSEWLLDEAQRATTPEAIPVKMDMPRDFYIMEDNIVLPVVPKTEQQVHLNEVLKYVYNPKNRISHERYGKTHFIPARNVFIPVDKQKVLANGTVSIKDTAHIVDTIKFTLSGGSIQRNTLALLDILSNFDWDRPIYVGSGFQGDIPAELHKYFRLEGFVYRFVPVEPTAGEQLVELDKLYDNLMNKYDWGNLDQPGFYVDNTIHRSYFVVSNVRNLFTNLANRLYEAGKIDSAKMVVERGIELFSDHALNYTGTTEEMALANLCYQLGMQEKGDEIYRHIASYFTEYYLYLEPSNKQYASYFASDMYRIINQLKREGKTAIADTLSAAFAAQSGIDFNQQMPQGTPPVPIK